MHRVQFTSYCMLAPVVACVQTSAELVVWGRSPQWREGNGSRGGGLHSDEGTRLCWCLERGGNSGYIWYIDLVTQIAVDVCMVAPVSLRSLRLTVGDFCVLKAFEHRKERLFKRKLVQLK